MISLIVAPPSRLSISTTCAEILVSAIDQRDSKLTLVSSMVGRKYEAEINREGTELNGTWTQGDNRLPLKLKRAAAQEKKP